MGGHPDQADEFRLANERILDRTLQVLLQNATVLALGLLIAGAIIATSDSLTDWRGLLVFAMAVSVAGAALLVATAFILILADVQKSLSTELQKILDTPAVRRGRKAFLNLGYWTVVASYGTFFVFLLKNML